MFVDRNRVLLSYLIAFGVGACTVLPNSPAFAQAANSGREINRAAIEEVFNQSLAQKRGVSIYIGSQVINGLFVKKIDENTIEVRNQQFGRILIRIDRIDAIAIS
jgi:hypothetical protein